MTYITYSGPNMLTVVEETTGVVERPILVSGEIKSESVIRCPAESHQLYIKPS